MYNVSLWSGEQCHLIHPPHPLASLALVGYVYFLIMHWHDNQINKHGVHYYVLTR